MSNNTQPQLLENYLITNAGLVDRHTIVLVAHWDDSRAARQHADRPPPVRVIVHNRARQSWGALELADGDFDSANSICGGIVAGRREALVVDSSGRTLFFGFAGNNGFEGLVPAAVLVPVRKVRLIGERYYAVSFERDVALREAPNRWRTISEEAVADYRRGGHTMSAVGFEDIDGFSEQDIYACGEQGDLWHYDGTHWRTLDPPCNWRMERLCCAADGLVYIVGFAGEVLVGRDEQWRRVVAEPQPFNVERIAWFQGRLYAVTHGFLFVLDGERWRGLDYGQDRRPSSFGYLDATEDALLVAGPDSATVFDGTRWETIIGGVSPTDLLRARLMQQQVDNLEGLRDALATHEPHRSDP